MRPSPFGRKKREAPGFPETSQRNSIVLRQLLHQVILQRRQIHRPHFRQYLFQNRALLNEPSRSGFALLDSVSGLRFRDEPYGLEAFLPYCAAISIATDSGAVGYHGLVTGILHPEQFAMVLTCGPMVMMRGVYQLCAQSGTPCVASLERKMACGLGACLGCTCRTKVGAKTVCKDGPVFKAEEVFD